MAIQGCASNLQSLAISLDHVGWLTTQIFLSRNSMDTGIQLLIAGKASGQSVEEGRQCD